MLTMRFPRRSIARLCDGTASLREPNDDRIDALLRPQRIGEAIPDDSGRGRRVEDRVAGQRDAVHAALAEPLPRVGVAIVDSLSRSISDAAGLSSLVEHANDDVAVLANDEMAPRSGALGEDRGAKTRPGA